MNLEDRINRIVNSNKYNNFMHKVDIIIYVLLIGVIISLVLTY